MSTFQVLLSCLLLVLSTAAAQLQAGFYSASCPQVESAVKALVGAAIGSGSDPDLAAKLLRLTFHDCFVNGCDGSILLDTAGAGTKTEKQAEENRSLRESGFQFLDKLKDAVEAQCPETVSCSDILALAARDAVSVPFGRDLWEVPTGRRDSRVSRAEDVPGNLPSQFDNFAKLKFMFERQNLSTNELVALSGAHTIGLSTCGSFSYRLYNFSGTGGVDPALDPDYAESLKKQCPGAPFVLMDPTSPGSEQKFDSGYFQAVRQKKGLFQSDAALLEDPASAQVVTRLQDPVLFLFEFGRAMEKMGSIGVLTGSAGEVRKNCRVVN